jgi:hypothetical protein
MLADGASGVNLKALAPLTCMERRPLAGHLVE